MIFVVGFSEDNIADNLEKYLKTIIDNRIQHLGTNRSGKVKQLSECFEVEQSLINPTLMDIRTKILDYLEKLDNPNFIVFDTLRPTQ